MRGLAILGSTGSIGVSALDVVSAFPERYLVTALAAGRNIELLATQIARFHPALVSIQRSEDRPLLLERLRAQGTAPLPEVLCGDEGPVAIASHPSSEIVLTAMVGAVGLRPTLAAIRRGAVVAIANKEPLVVAGALCREQARRHGATLLPVDSEHSAIFQALRGHRREDVRRLLLTGSGGPFRTVNDLARVTVEQALAHPTWSMGPKITVDSATLMNKGLEVIEAHWLFGVPAAQIEVLIHPESIVHSIVEYVDGSHLAQLGLPDMRIPIAYALAYPGRLPLPLPRLDLVRSAALTFAAPDPERFPCLALAYEALHRGGSAPAVLNAANEIAVAAFLRGELRFVDIPAVIERTLETAAPSSSALDLDALLEVDAWARRVAAEALRG